MAKNKEITLRAFTINTTPTLSSQSRNLMQELKDRLDNSITESRIMLINQSDETAESDLLSDFTLSDANIFATMMRIALGADDVHISQEFFQQKTFPVSQLQKKENNAAAVYKEHCYVCVDQNFLVTTLPKKTPIKRVEVYLNWLIGTHVYELTPLVVHTSEIALSDIKSIKVVTPSKAPETQLSFNDKAEKKTIGLNRTTINGIFMSIFTDTKSLEQIDLDQVIMAELIFKFNKPRSMTDTEFQKKFGALLKPVSDIENIVFQDRKGNKISGTKFLKTKKVSIEQTDSGLISENELHNEMSRFLDEVRQ